MSIKKRNILLVLFLILFVVPATIYLALSSRVYSEQVLKRRITANISTLAPTPEPGGGKLRVTSVDFNTSTVYYEDDKNQYIARFEYGIYKRRIILYPPFTLKSVIKK